MCQETLKKDDIYDISINTKLVFIDEYFEKILVEIKKLELDIGELSTKQTSLFFAHYLLEYILTIKNSNIGNIVLCLNNRYYGNISDHTLKMIKKIERNMDIILYNYGSDKFRECISFHDFLDEQRKFFIQQQKIVNFISIIRLINKNKKSQYQLKETSDFINSLNMNKIMKIYKSKKYSI